VRRRVLLPLLGAGALVLLAAPLAHADVWANVGPASSAAGLASRWPLGNYALDEHFTAISAGVFSGVDVSGLLPMIAYFFADELWQLTAWLASLVVELFGFAFSLDLVNGSSATGGAGALGPVSRAISSIYADVLGGPWMVVGVSVAGIWAMWKALVQRRYAETAGQLALSLVYVGIAFLFVLQPGRTIGAASHWTNAMSGAFLSIAKDGQPESQGEAREAGSDQLFGLLVAQPWSVLEFGGLDHCVKAGGGEEPESVAVQPLPRGAARRLESGETVSADGKTCIADLRKYGPHFLRFEPGSKEREAEFDALEAGDSSKLPDADPGKKGGSYELGPVDTPAAAAMEKGGQYQRLLVAIVVFVAELGAFCLLGALSVGVITAQVLLLLLLAFSPVALVAAAIPGRGHRFFKGWLAKLAGFLLRKAAYSLVLAVLLAVCAAISAATSELGWLFSFGLQCAFFWAVFLQRRSLTDGLIGAVTGPGVPGRDRALDAVALYMGARTGTRLAGRPLRAARSRVRGRASRAQAPDRDLGIEAPARSGPSGERPAGRETRKTGRPEQTPVAAVATAARREGPRLRPNPRPPEPGSSHRGPHRPVGEALTQERADGDAPVRRRPARPKDRPVPEKGRPARPDEADAHDGRPDGRRSKRSRRAPTAGVLEPRHKEDVDTPAGPRENGRPAAPTPSRGTTRPQERGDLTKALRADEERARKARPRGPEPDGRGKGGETPRRARPERRQPSAPRDARKDIPRRSPRQGARRSRRQGR
jgi:hypothetical protein